MTLITSVEPTRARMDTGEESDDTHDFLPHSLMKINEQLLGKTH
jgi:hypothetical protein